MQLIRPTVFWKQWHRYSLEVDPETNIVTSLSMEDGFKGPALAVHTLSECYGHTCILRLHAFTKLYYVCIMQWRWNTCKNIKRCEWYHLVSLPELECNILNPAVFLFSYGIPIKDANQCLTVKQLLWPPTHPSIYSTAHINPATSNCIQPTTDCWPTWSSRWAPYMTTSNEGSLLFFGRKSKLKGQQAD
jgi:hypothetical protein